jgi:subtilisin family serine protease
LPVALFAVERGADRADSPRSLRSVEWNSDEMHAAQQRNPTRASYMVTMAPNANRGPVRAFAQQKGGVVKYEYSSVLPHTVNLRNMPRADLNALKNMPGVMKVEEDNYGIHIRLDESIPLINGLQSQITTAGFNADGSGVRVCVADTGIDSDHIMYSSRIDASAGYDFYNDDNNPEDDEGHGSHVSGIAVGGTGLTVDFGCDGPEDFQGVAPGATLIGVKILNQFGGGFDSDIIAGIDHCADQSGSGAQADVINLSIGTGNFSSGSCTHSWAVAANNAVANGVVVVAASGNENNSNSMGSPACGADVIAVGATYKTDYPNCENGTSNWNWGNCTDQSPAEDQIVCFSNESDHLDVAAPGSHIYSASTASGGSNITEVSGTSQASPHVAGLAALLLELDPNLTPAQVRQHIRDGAIDMGPAGFDRAYGYGRIDVTATLALISPCTTNGDCDDGQYCNGSETCNGGTCSSGTAVNCDDGVACTDDSCDEGSDSCVNSSNDGLCDDGDPCTDDTCNGSSCDNTPVSPCCGDGICESGEDCNSCSADCISGSGGDPCGNGVCEPSLGEDCLSCGSDCRGVQSGRPSNRYCCGDGDGQNPADCNDSRCSSGGYDCSDTPVGGGDAYCCGDDVCEGDENETNCAVDCSTSCVLDSDCDDGDSCTQDSCNGGVCSNVPPNCDDGDACTNDFCSGGSCTTSPVNCDDGDACTTDSCDSGSGCSNTPIPGCGCAPSGGSCNSNSDCCSNKCKGNGTCK